MQSVVRGLISCFGGVASWIPWSIIGANLTTNCYVFFGGRYPGTVPLQGEGGSKGAAALLVFLGYSPLALRIMTYTKYGFQNTLAIDIIKSTCTLT